MLKQSFFLIFSIFFIFIFKNAKSATPQVVMECPGLKNFKNLTRWYLEISNREAVIKGYAFMKSGEVIPKP